MTRLEDYRVPGTNIVSWSAYSRANIPKPAHDVPLGQVVWLSHDEGACHGIKRDASGREIVLSVEGREKLIVVGHGQDCDGTAMYNLAAEPIAMPQRHLFNEPLYSAVCRRVVINVVRESITPVEGERLELAASVGEFFFGTE